MNLKGFQNKYNIRRIDFDKVKPVKNDTEYSSDQLICPYCGSEIEYDGEETEDILKGTPWQCPDCEKWFYAEGEVSIETTCTPIENKVLNSFTRRCIESNYEHMDKCEEKGCEWEDDRPYGNVEYETYKEYAEPLFANMESEET